MAIERGGHTFAGVDKPIRTPSHKSGKSHAVVIKKGDGFKLIRFGMQGAKTKPPRKGESDADKAKRKSLKLDTQKILLKVKQVQHIGLIRLNGRLSDILKKKLRFIHGRRK
ncbi:hypothetical protein [uncultured phage MedDCM-OCT-S08-C620]|nr:hypothetical protein [uncultured phage MedDCM-OCT-S08-C620]